VAVAVAVAVERVHSSWFIAASAPGIENQTMNCPEISGHELSRTCGMNYEPKQTAAFRMTSAMNHELSTMNKIKPATATATATFSNSRHQL